MDHHPDPEAMDWRKYTSAELEKQMSPRLWVHGKDPDQTLQEYIELSTAATVEAQQKIPNTLNVSYGSLPSQKFDLYGTDLREEAPIFIWVHGGYWQILSKEVAGGFAPLVRSAGVKTVVLGFTLAPAGSRALATSLQTKVGDMVEELISALALLAKTNPHAKFIVGGHCAGAQTAAILLHWPKMPLELSERIVGLFLVSGVFDLEPLIHTHVNEPLKMDRDEAILLSPLCRPFIISPHKLEELEILIMCAEHDSPEFQRQSWAYFEQIQEFRQQGQGEGRLTFHQVEGDNHFTIVENMGAVDDVAAAADGPSSAGILVEFLKKITDNQN